MLKKSEDFSGSQEYDVREPEDIFFHEMRVLYEADGCDINKTLLAGAQATLRSAFRGVEGFEQIFEEVRDHAAHIEAADGTLNIELDEKYLN